MLTTGFNVFHDTNGQFLFPCPFFAPCRQHRHRGRQAETDPGSDMAAYSPLLHLHAHVGRGGGCGGGQEAVAQGQAPGMDQEQGDGQAHPQLRQGLERWPGHRRSG